MYIYIYISVNKLLFCKLKQEFRRSIAKWWYSSSHLKRSVYDDIFLNGSRIRRWNRQRRYHVFFVQFWNDIALRPPVSWSILYINSRSENAKPFGARTRSALRARGRCYIIIIFYLFFSVFYSIALSDREETSSSACRNYPCERTRVQGEEIVSFLPVVVVVVVVV